jgi:hypothetical protein
MGADFPWLGGVHRWDEGQPEVLVRGGGFIVYECLQLPPVVEGAFWLSLQQHLPQAVSPHWKLKGTLEASEGDQECMDGMLVKDTIMRIGHLMHDATTEHGIMSIQRIVQQPSGFKQALKRVGDCMPDGKASPHFKVGCGVFRLGWHRGSMYHGKALVGHSVGVGQRDAGKPWPLHHHGVGEVGPKSLNHHHLIIVVIRGRVRCRCGGGLQLQAGGLVQGWVARIVWWTCPRGVLGPVPLGVTVRSLQGMLQSFSFHLVNVARVSGTVIDSMLMVIARFMRAVTLLGLTAVVVTGEFAISITSSNPWVRPQAYPK